MCWNKEVSISSFVIISLICYKLYIRNLPHDRMLAVFIMTYGSMQLFEAIIWTGIDFKMPSLNYLGSFLASIVLFTHALGLVYGISIDKSYQENINTQKFKRMKIAALSIFIFGLVYIVYNIYQKNYPYSLVINDSLFWNFNKLYILVCLTCVYISMIIYHKNKHLWGFLVVYFTLPILILLYLNKFTGSYWCWYVAFFAFFIYLINPWLQKFNIKTNNSKELNTNDLKLK